MTATRDRSPLARPRWIVALFAVLALAGAACGGGDNGASGAAPQDPTDEADGRSPTGGDGDPAEPPVSGEGSATLTMSDGTEYSFAMSTCDTSDNAPDSFLVDPGYDLFGKSDDGFRIQFIRAGFDESDVVLTNSFEGDFDDGGGNPTVSYSGGDYDPGFSVDGGDVSGTVTLDNGPGGDPIHGETTEATLAVSC